ncbi:MAG: DUF3429 domain-containing protein [Brachymonas sp.]|nr:DUF3429 domain-containing protein [Brachymonas sp.]
MGLCRLGSFVLPALLLWTVEPDLRNWLAIGLTAYAAIIASFLGGIHWGIAAQIPAEKRNFHLIWGVVPSIVAWIGSIMPAYAGLPLMAALLITCYGVDRKSYPHAGWAPWLPLRLRLTVVAALSCLLGAGAI